MYAGSIQCTQRSWLNTCMLAHTVKKALCVLLCFPYCLAKCPYLRMPFVRACPARDSLRIHLPYVLCPPVITVLDLYTLEFLIRILDEFHITRTVVLVLCGINESHFEVGNNIVCHNHCVTVGNKPLQISHHTPPSGH